MVKRWYVVSPVVIALALGGMVSASAAETVVVSHDGMPAGISAEGRTCLDPSPALNPAGYLPEPATVTHVEGPSTPPRGFGSLAVVPGAGKDAGLRLTSLPMPMANLTALSVDVRKPLEAMGAAVDVVVRSTYSNKIWLGTNGMNLPANAWIPVDFSALKLSWVSFNGGLDPGQLTIAEFAQTVGPSEQNTLQLEWLMIHAGTCGSTPEGTTFNFDNLRVGISGNDTVYDFEPPSTPTTTAMMLSKPTITYGGNATVTTQVSGPGTVQLFGRPAGSSSFSQVASAGIDGTGKASVVVAPTASTTYEWRYPGSAGFAPSTSEQKTLAVASKVTIKLADKTVGTGARLVATGKVTPKAAGKKVTLWRSLAGGKKAKLGKAKVKKSGRYEVSGVAKSAGKWKVFVTVAATKVNASGTSKVVSVMAR